MSGKIILTISLLVFLTAGLYSDDSENSSIDKKYYHTHDDSDHIHDLTLAMIDFEADKITDPESQLWGKWELMLFQTTDHDMDTLVRNGTFKIWFTVYEDYMQVTVVTNSNNKEYKDPEVMYNIIDGDIVIEHGDFNAALKGEFLVFAMLGMDEAYRYTFVKE